jgi:CHAD domain-containing protein
MALATNDMNTTRTRHESGSEQKPRRSSRSAEVVLAYLRTQATALRTLEPKVRADEPDAVHKMRLAVRRVRSTLRSFGRVIEDRGSLAGELKWLGDLLGAERDNEVLPRYLQAHLDHTPSEHVIGPVRGRVQGHYAPRRAAAHADVLTALDSARYLTILAELDRLVAEPPPGLRADAPASKTVSAVVRRTHAKARKRMRRARHAPAGRERDIALHQARKAIKRARYAGEAASPAFGKKAKRFTRQMKNVQSVLGEHQDAVIASEAARELGIAAYLAGENAFTYGLLQEHARREREHLQAEARQAWKRASRPRLS